MKINVVSTHLEVPWCSASNEYSQHMFCGEMCFKVVFLFNLSCEDETMIIPC